MRWVGISRLCRSSVGICGPLRFCTLAPSDELVQLRREVKALRQELVCRAETMRQLVDMVRPSESGTAAKSCERHILRTVEDDEALERALREATPRVILLPNREYSLLPAPFVVRGEKRVEIVGAATLNASFKLSEGASLSMSEVRIVSHAPNMPAIEASASTVVLANCTVSGGRDGVYLSSGSHLHGSGCRFEGNARGVFEGFRCGVHLSRNSFENNLFHLVLLASASHKRVDELQPLNSFGGERTRGDFVFQYNPVSDHYSDVFRDGVPVVLTEEHSTANLVDPTW